MQRGKNQVTGNGGAQTDLRRFLVAHFADQNDVRVVTEDRAQHPAEGKVDFFVDLHLADAGSPVLDLSLDSDDLFLDRVDFCQGGVERGRLAASRRTGYQHHATLALRDATLES